MKQSALLGMTIINAYTCQLSPPPLNYITILQEIFIGASVLKIDEMMAAGQLGKWQSP